MFLSIFSKQYTILPSDDNGHYVSVDRTGRMQSWLETIAQPEIKSPICVENSLE